MSAGTRFLRSNPWLRHAPEMMTVTTIPILETLAREFKTSVESVRGALEMIDAGLTAPFIGRYRRNQVGALSESLIRRLDRARGQLEELERRKGTILRLMEKEPETPAKALEQIKACTDRFEVEDLFLPHRRPEPEVQLAMDRGLDGLADLIIKQVPREQRPAEEPKAEKAEGEAPEAEEVKAEEIEAVETKAAEPEAKAAEPEAKAAEPEAKAEEPEPKTKAKAHKPTSKETILTPELARLCVQFVSPDRGVHNESEALAGAMRVLSARLGRNPRLRGQLRQMMRKHGVLTVRALVDDKKAGRHKGLLKINRPMRQIQGNRLLSIRQAQKDRILTTRISVDRGQALKRVADCLGRHLEPGVEGVVAEVCARALDRRLLPMIEEDVRLELKERADAEALRFLSQHLRQILLTPVLARRSKVVGIDVNAKGDWILSAVDSSGTVISTEELRIEVGEKDAAALGAELNAALGSLGPEAAAVSSGKSSRAALAKLRSAFTASEFGLFVFLVSDAGLSSYANSEGARKELVGLSISQRMAVSLARRLQDPMNELIKVEPRHLSLGSEQGLVSKANVRRCFTETVESCAAHVGCDVNRAPARFLAALPGLDAAAAAKIIEQREKKPIESRTELRDEGILTEAQWASSVGFLRVPGSCEALDRSNLHPEQYVLARQLIEAVGSTMEDGLGRMGITKGLKRSDFDVDGDTWRDLMRELSHPGRDPRFRLHVPQLLEAETDRARLVRDRVVEGLVSNVTSFGAFIDIGLAQDALVHISEVSSHYVRDARELLSVGQMVRARIIDGSGPRLTLSLKNVPREVREHRPRPGGRSAGASRGRGAGRQRDERPATNPNLRAAQSRRDGLGGSGSGGRGRGGGGGGGGRGGGGAGARGRGDRHQDEGDRFQRSDLTRLNEESKKAAANPFADFFKEDE
jgi:uncharacterized protein